VRRFLLIVVPFTLVVQFQPVVEARAESRWPDERSAGAFLCHADFSLSNHTHLLDEMAQLQRDLARTLGINEPREPIHLFLFEQPSTYESYLKLYFPQVPSRRAMFIKQRPGYGMVFAYKSSDFQVDVRHEGTHAVLHADLPMVPLWLDEGLAEYFETPPAWNGLNYRHLGALRSQPGIPWTPSLARLDRLTVVKDMNPADYREAWAWVHFMLRGSPQAKSVLLAYLQQLRTNKEPGPFEPNLAAAFPSPEGALRVHFQRLEAITRQFPATQ
jgi:hypothetical protein